MRASKFIAMFLAVGFVVLLSNSIRHTKSYQIDGVYKIVKSEDCYSYRNGTWVSPSCWDNFEEVSFFVERLKRQDRIKENAYKKNWEDVEE